MYIYLRTTIITKVRGKLGFIKEGLLRNYEFARGKFHYLYMYSLLKEDFGKIIEGQTK